MEFEVQTELIIMVAIEIRVRDTYLPLFTTLICKDHKVTAKKGDKIKS